MSKNNSLQKNRPKFNPNNPHISARQRIRILREEKRREKVGFFRRVWRVVTHWAFVTPLVLLIVGAFLFLGYYWTEYSERIDRMLSGQIFTRSAGIYSAPKTLKVGAEISPQDLIGYLKGANYVEENQPAESGRGRYSFDGVTLQIKPGEDSKIDNVKNYKPLTVKFSKDGRISSIVESESNQALNSAQIEPRMLSSITGAERERRKTVAYKDLPESLIKAIIVTEDRAFFEHYGVNFRGIARALWRRVEKDDDNSPLANQGGSSITQQLVKNLFLSNEQTLTRKAQEAYMSIILETRLSKQEIFTLYCNQVYLGQQAGFSLNGVGEAANAYFGKDVTALTLPESAFLAGIIRSPNRYKPYKNPEKVTERRNQVLDSMLEAGAISAAEANEAKNTPLKLTPPTNRLEISETPYFTEYAQSELAKIVTDSDALRHLRVYTTLDLDLQRAAQNAVTKGLNRLDKYFPKAEPGSLQAALVAIKPKTGEVVAMIGGRDYLQNQFNRATDAQRQPGSVFKPFVFAAAINTAYDPSPRVITAASTFKDEKQIFTYGNESYTPNNYGDFFSNKEVTLRDALVKSKNVITVDLAMQLNVGKVMNLAAKAGLPRVEKAYPSMALGTAEVTPLQMASAYTAFANLGQRAAPLTVSRVTNGEGKTIAAPVPQKNEVLRPDVAFVMNDMMKDVINRGTAVDAQKWGFKNIPGKFGVAGKTGTSRDGWFAGFTPDLVCVVYVGFDDGRDLDMKGSDSALPIWADFMREALDLHPEWNGDWKMPDGIRRAEIDIRNGKTIRELDKETAAHQTAGLPTPKPTATPTATPTPDDESEFGIVDAPLGMELPASVSNEEKIDVPPEFRRIELFLSGTIPGKWTKPVDDKAKPEKNLPPTAPIESATPATEIQDAPTKATPENSAPKPLNREPRQEPTPLPTATPRNPDRFPRAGETVILSIDPETGRIASPSCPTSRATVFKRGEEPTKFCGPEFHQRKNDK